MKRNKKGQFVKGVIPEGSILFKKGQTPWNKGKKFPELSGENSPAWKGGKILHQGKYWLIYKPDHPRADVKGYVREHRLVVEESIGRCLEKWEIVHHINHDTKDNRIENLEITDRKKHIKMHLTELIKRRWNK